MHSRYVGVEGDAVDDGGDQPRVGKHRVIRATRRWLAPLQTRCQPSRARLGATTIMRVRDHLAAAVYPMKRRVTSVFAVVRGDRLVGVSASLTSPVEPAV